MAAIKQFLLNPPSPSAMFNTYASYNSGFMLLRSMVPVPIQQFLYKKFRQYILRPRKTSTTTIIIEQLWGTERNQLYDAATLYLPTKISPGSYNTIKKGKIPSKKNLSTALPDSAYIVDTFNNLKVTWHFVCNSQTSKESSGIPSQTHEKRFFELCFDSVHEKEITSAYLQHVMDVSTYLEQEDKELKIYSCNSDSPHHYHPHSSFERKNGSYLRHPASFDTIAMDPKLKQSVIDDLDKFLDRKDYYRRIGKAWKRGYLLYGPPGTGKSSLIIAMAKYLKYDVYELELSGVHSNSHLKNIILAMSNKSILVIEDIDCYDEVHARSETVDVVVEELLAQKKKLKHSSYTLSGILNAIDGLWSGCGEERIIVFTTNHKDKIDPALLRPGRMDMHIELSYLTPSAFPLLAFNYLGVRDGENLLVDEIKGLLESVEVTPASVAEELLRSDEDAEAALNGVVNLLKRKREEEGEVKNGGGDKGSMAVVGTVFTPPPPKRMKS